GIGFAVPADVANLVVPPLIAKGKVPRPGIGITVLSEEMTATLGVVGVVIDRVMPGPEADRGGLEGIDYANRVLGDVIVTANGESVEDLVDFTRILQEFEIGQTVRLEVLRGDRTREVEVRVMDIS